MFAKGGRELEAKRFCKYVNVVKVENKEDWLMLIIIIPL